jgi:hypothetical protein
VIQCIIIVIFVISVLSFYKSAVVSDGIKFLNDHDPSHTNSMTMNTTAKKHKIPHNDQTGDEVQQNLIQHFDEPEDDSKSQKTIRKIARTTAEANAYMASQKTESVNGEQALKKKLVKLYDKQKNGNDEDSSPIVTRWLGKDNVPHWLPKSSTSEADIAKWRKQVEGLKQEMRDKDVVNFPELHGKIRNGHQDSTKTIYPSPTRDGTRPIIKPTFGKHRPHVDAMFALAEGYDLKIYLLFIESIKQTGFTGDLVLSVSAISELKHGVEDYLRSQQREEGEDGINIVGYTVTWTCYEGDGVTVAKGANEGVRKCALVDMYGDSTDGTAIKDPREPRPVATARYELYWAWSLHYDPHSWMMLIDSRDAYFQLNPFSTVERENESSRDDGLLYFFEVSISNYRDHLSGSIHILPTCVPQPKWRLAGK